jgi:hypothetical protein
MDRKLEEATKISSALSNNLLWKLRQRVTLVQLINLRLLPQEWMLMEVLKELKQLLW